MKLKNKCIRKIEKNVVSNVKPNLLDEMIGIINAEVMKLKEEVKKEIKDEVDKQTPSKYWLWIKRLGISYLICVYIYSRYTSLQGMSEITFTELIKLFVSL